MSASVPLMPERLRSIEFLRGIAALGVLLQHAITFGNHAAIDAPWFKGLFVVLNHGHLGVPLFFVISGFCIHMRWSKRHAETGAQGIAFVSFWKRRIHRLYPSYFVVLCGSMGLVLAAYLLGRSVPLVELYPDPVPRWMTLDFLAHVTMLHGLHPLFDKAGGNPPFWSLAREEYLYLLYFALLAMRRRTSMIRTTAFVLIAGIAFHAVMSLTSLQLHRDWWTLISTSAIVLWIQWCLGALAVEVHHGLARLPRFCQQLPFVPVWMVLAKLSTGQLGLLAPLCWGMAFFTLVNWCVARERTGNWQRNRVTEWLANVGVFSYSLYLVHYPVRGVVKQLLGPLADTTDVWVYLGLVLLMSACGYWTAKAFFSVVESRFVTPTGSAASRGMALNDQNAA